MRGEEEGEEGRGELCTSCIEEEGGRRTWDSSERRMKSERDGRGGGKEERGLGFRVSGFGFDGTALDEGHYRLEVRLVEFCPISVLPRRRKLTAASAWEGIEKGEQELRFVSKLQLNVSGRLHA